MEDDEEDVKKLNEYINELKQEDIQLKDFDNISDIEDESDDDLDEEVSTFIPNPNPEISSLINREVPLYKEEQDIIENCEHIELKNLMILNRKKNMQLLEMFTKVKELLKDCQNSIELQSEQLKKRASEMNVKRKIGVRNIRAPYFKDKELYGCPVNEDVKRKWENKELTVYELSYSVLWTDRDCKKLQTGVLTHYHANIQRHILKQIEQVTSSNELTDVDKGKLVLELREQLNELKENKNLIPPLKTNLIDWAHISSYYINGKHTLIECQAFWDLYISPNINKSAWTQEESQEAKQIAAKYKFQNWDAIAQELNTNRSGLIVCMHYFRNLRQKASRRKFTDEEDESIIELVNLYKRGNHIPWPKISRHFENRTRDQIFHRYKYYLSNDNIKYGKFSDEEDILLMVLVDKLGRNFSKCEKYFPNRSQVQLKARFNSNLKLNIAKGSFSLTDDEIIWDFVQKNGTKNWSGLVPILDRCRGQIRQRYYVIERFLKANEFLSIKDVPRRAHLELNKKKNNYLYLRCIADQFRNAPIPTLDDIKGMLKTSVESELPCVSQEETRVQNIEKLLVKYFCEAKTKQNDNINQLLADVEVLLSAFDVSLEIPEDVDVLPYLDNVDKYVLRNLYSKRKKPVQFSLLPPNIATLIGLKHLMITYRLTVFGEALSNIYVPVGLKEIKRFVVDSDEEVLIEEEKVFFLNEKERFYQRFKMIFNWSLFLTLTKPNENLVESLFSKTKRKRMKAVIIETSQGKRMKLLQAEGTKDLVRVDPEQFNLLMKEGKVKKIYNITTKIVKENSHNEDENKPGCSRS